jgi:hypothetical protein
VASRFAQIISGGDGTPGLFPTTQCGLCIFLLSLYTPPEHPSEAEVVPELPGQVPLTMPTVNLALPPVFEPFCSL